MISYLVDHDKHNCTGCGACQETCPKSCISLKEDNYGFCYPVVDDSTCIHCNRCVNACHIQNDFKKRKPIATYAASTKDNMILLNSSSGGIFTEICKNVLSKGGIVYGAFLDNDFQCHHIRVDNEEDLFQIRKSKYVQSDIVAVLKKIHEELDSNRTILFSGTPCQIAALKTFLRNDYSNLICVDIACHGVPCEKDFLYCKEYIEKLVNGRVCNIDFRSKKTGWSHKCEIAYSDSTGEIKTRLYSPIDIPYYYFFLHGHNFRDSCYTCKYASTERVSDLTLADCWGIETIKHSFNVKHGVSMVLVNTHKGETIFNDIKEQLKVLRIEDDFPAKHHNQPFIKPCDEPINRERILDNINSNGYKNIKAYLPYKDYIFEKIKALVPERIKILISSLLGKLA